MKSLALTFGLLIALAGCQSAPQSGSTSVPGHGAVTISIVPNPIMARQVSGDTYDFPFEVVVRETGGRAVTINRVSANVLGPANISLAEESWDAGRIQSMGYGTSLPPHGELRYRFSPRKEVPDDRLFGSVSAELRVDAMDDTGSPANATTIVTVAR
jgi:hypothetical protein